MARLYVGNIPWKATENGLAAHFSAFGVTEVKIITERETGRSRGFAFVEVSADPDAVISACNGQLFDGRQLRVSHAERKKTPASDQDAKDFASAWNNR